jgi:7-carboxy-7-deazaguanine synthase
MNKHAFSEIFYSIQGEGKYTGVPTAWLRFFLCNLQCNGFGQKDPTDESTYVLPYKDFDTQSVNRIEDLPVWQYGCDSSYSWASKFKHLQYRKTAAEICDQIQQEMTNEWNPTGTFHHPKSHVEQHMCFTGGEPLMPHGQAAVVDIMREFSQRPGGAMEGGFIKGNNLPESITFETNGTQGLRPEFVEFFDNPGLYPGELFFSVSPKLWTVAGEKRSKAIKPDVVKEYYRISKGRGQLKFVIGAGQEQWDELDEVVDLFRQAGVYYPIHIMPTGATEEGQAGELEGHSNAGKVADMALARGYHVSARVHVYLYGNIIGV